MFRTEQKNDHPRSRQDHYGDPVARPKDTPAHDGDSAKSMFRTEQKK